MSDVTLAFDFGMRRIGVAIGSPLTGAARALTTLHHHGDPDWHAIGDLIDQWRPDTLVVGLPLLADGTEQSITGHARGFMDDLRQRYGLAVYAVDERYSSTAAESELRQQRASGSRKHRVKKGDSDAVAARIILETWLAMT